MMMMMMMMMMTMTMRMMMMMMMTKIYKYKNNNIPCISLNVSSEMRALSIQAADIPWQAAAANVPGPVTKEIYKRTWVAGTANLIWKMTIRDERNVVFLMGCNRNIISSGPFFISCSRGPKRLACMCTCL